MNYIKIFKAFILWRIFLFIVLFISIPILSLQFSFVGFGLSNYLESPQLWAWANFDGEHYLNIAKYGYGFGEHAFFPLYPYLIRLLASLFGNSSVSYIYSGLIISNFSFLIGLVGLTKLAKMDHKKEVVYTALLLLLLFPTSFFFGSLYTEGLFFALTVWSFYFARRGNWIAAGVIGGLASLTRFLGVILFPVLLIEALQKGWKGSIGRVLPLLPILLGLIGYSYFLSDLTSDPLAFINTLSGFGEQRQTDPVLLPQVFYRYIFKIFPNLDLSYFPAVFTTFLEMITAIVFTLLSLAGLATAFSRSKGLKIRPSYLIYFLVLFIIPTLTGSFSSLPRYVLVIFPAFLLSAQYLVKTSRLVKYTIFATLLLLLFITEMLFVRGYFVS